MRLRVPVLLLAVLLPLGLVAGCSEDKAEPATGPGLPSQADLKSYFQAITGSDLDALAAAQTEVAAEGSLAQGYAAYVAEYNIAANAADAPVDPFDVEEVDNGFKACVGDSPDQCATWTDLEGKDGKLANFTVNGRKLDELLVDLRGQAPIESPGLYSGAARMGLPPADERQALRGVHGHRHRRPALVQAGDVHRGGPDIQGCRRRAGSRDHQAW